MTKNFFQKLNRTSAVLFLLGILAIINFLAGQIFWRLDLTQNKDYSLSAPSKKIAEKLDDIINIKAYFSDNLPGQYLSLRQDVKDILDEYANYSNGKIIIKFISPEEDEKIKQELYSAGIPELQFNVLEKDKYQVINGYLGVVIQYGDKKEIIPVVENTQSLEYQITLALKKLTSSQMPVIGYIASSEKEAASQTALKELQKVYNLRKIDLSIQDNALDEIKTLIIIGGEDLALDDLKKIDNFLMQGKSLLVLADGVKVGEGLSAEANNIALNGLIAKYGIKINNNLVLDVSSGFTSFSRGYFSFAINYPFWPKVIKSGFDQNNAAVSKLEGIVLPWASSLDANIQNPAAKISYLAQTTDQAWTQNNNFNLAPDQQFFPSGNIGKHNLAISLFGAINSAYQDEKSAEARLIVVGDSEFLEDNYLRQAGDNLAFLQNLTDILSIDEDLIDIRSQGITDRPIKEISESLKNILKYFNIFGATILVIIFGFSRNYFRTRKKDF